jgi:hypothetical protein
VTPEMIADTSLQRPRLTQPVNPLTRALENYQAGLSAPPDYGQDSQGNQRTQAKRGFGGRALAFLKTLGTDVLQGRGVVPAAADATYSAINPDRLAQERLQRVRAGNQQEVGNQIGIANEQAKIASEQTDTAYKNVLMRDKLNPPEKFTYRKQGGITYRIGADGKAAPLMDMQGNELPPEVGQPHVREVLAEDGITKILSQWNPQTGKWGDVTRNGAPARTGYTPPVDPATGMTPAQAAATRDRRANLEIRRQAEGRQQGNLSTEDARKQAEVEAVNANIDRQTTELKKEQAANEALAIDPNASPYDRDQAKRRAQQVRDEIGRIERQKKAPFVPRVQGASGKPAKDPLGLFQ